MKRFCLFAKAYEDKDAVIDSKKRQRSHHRHESFRDELKRLLIKAGIDFHENRPA